MTNTYVTIHVRKLEDGVYWEQYVKVVQPIFAQLSASPSETYTENKVAKSTGLLYRVKPFLSKHSLSKLYYSYIQSYLNYVNLSRASTNRTDLKKLLR